MKITRYELLAIAWFIAAGVLLVDSIGFTFYVPNPSAGRIGGCYTILDLMCGVRVPADWMRLAQLCGSVLMIVLGLTISLYLRWRNKNVAGKG